MLVFLGHWLFLDKGILSHALVEHCCLWRLRAKSIIGHRFRSKKVLRIMLAYSREHER